MSKPVKNEDKLRSMQAERKGADDISSLYRHDLRASHSTDSRGDELVKKAKKLIDKFNPANLFAGEGRWEKASDLFAQAGAVYKMADNWEEAGDALVQAAELQEAKVKNSVEAAAFYASAAKAYRSVDTEKAIATFKLSVSLHMENGRHRSAAAGWEEIAALQTEEELHDEALDSWEAAANCYEAEGTYAAAVQVYVKLAALYLERGEWSKAGDQYEKAGKVSVENAINKGSVHEYLYMALLAYFVQSSQHYDTELPRAKYADYVSMDRRHEGSREFKLVLRCMEAFDQEDSKAFVKAIAEHNKVRDIDDVSAKCLLRVKQALKAGPPSHVTQGADEQLGDDDYT